MDKDIFAARIQQLNPRLYRTAFLHLGDETKALDAVAEAVYRGLVSVKQLREPAFFDTWMMRILINECNKTWRRTKREQPLATIPEQAENDPALDALPLKQAICQLPQELKEVVILRYYSDFTLAETAKCLDIPQGTVVTRQRRALKLLRLELSEEVET